jgi:hypothetical protein
VGIRVTTTSGIDDLVQFVSKNMSFILVPSEGEDIQINAWNWRPTLELLFAAGVITVEDHARLGGQGLGGKVDEAKALLIAEVVMRRLVTMKPGERMPADLSVSNEPKQPVVFSPGMKADDIDGNELYSATYEWLEAFARFCRDSKGFEVR